MREATTGKDKASLPDEGKIRGEVHKIVFANKLGSLKRGDIWRGLERKFGVPAEMFRECRDKLNPITDGAVQLCEYTKKTAIHVEADDVDVEADFDLFG